MKKRLTAVFRTQTSNGITCKNSVHMPNESIIAIKQRILAPNSDIENGWFSNWRLVRKFKDYQLVECEMVLWTDSFEMVNIAVEQLKTQFKL